MKIIGTINNIQYFNLPVDPFLSISCKPSKLVGYVVDISVHDSDGKLVHQGVKANGNLIITSNSITFPLSILGKENYKNHTSPYVLRIKCKDKILNTTSFEILNTM